MLVPDLATEVPSAANGGISADGKVYTFHLKKGIKFAQPISTEVTAADFKWSFERMMKEPLAPATFFYTGIVGAQDFMDGKAKDISGYKVVDPNTVQITLEKPDGAFLMAMTMPFTSVMSKAWCAKVGKQIKRKPLGTGPYVITNWTAGQSITAEKNTNWTGTSQQWVDKMEFDFTANPSTALLRLERGEVDVLGDSIPSADYIRTRNDPTWSKYIVSRAADRLVLRLHERAREAVRQHEGPPGDQLRDRHGARSRSCSPGQGQSLNQIYPNGMPGYQADKQFYTYDPAKAKQLLADAGFPNGFKTTFVTHNVDPFPKLAQAVQADLKAVGINAEHQADGPRHLLGLHQPQEVPRRHRPQRLVPGLPGPERLDRAAVHATRSTAGPNSSFYENPQVNTLYGDSASELDSAKRIDMFEQMQDIIMTDAPTAPLYQPTWNGMYGKTTGGYYINPVWIFTFQDYWKTDGK